MNSLLHDSDFLDTTDLGVVLYDQAGTVVDCNERMLELLDADRGELVGRSVLDGSWRVVRESGTPFEPDELPGVETLRTGKSVSGVVMGIDTPGRARKWVTVHSCVVEVDTQSRGVISSYLDITAYVQRDQMLHLLLEINRFVAHATSEDDLLQHLCDILVHQAGYALAWVGAAPARLQGAIQVMCAAGATGYLEPESESPRRSISHGAFPSGSASALRTGLTQVSNDLLNDARYRPFRDQGERYGLRSAVVIPFFTGDHSVICIYDHHSFAFDEETVERLEQIAKAVEFGITHVHSTRQIEIALDESIQAVAAQREAEHDRSEMERRFLLAFEHSMAPMVFKDLRNQVIEVNDAYCEFIGRDRERLIGSTLQEFAHPDDVAMSAVLHRRLLEGEIDRARYVKRFVHADGRIIIAEISKASARNEHGDLLYFVASVRDITEERALTTQLTHQALHDPLTGLANRALFDDRLTQAHARSQRRGHMDAVFLLDLDDFKGINDAHGHMVGDELLVAVAHRLRGASRTSDTLCRFGGDEFLYLAEGLTSAREARSVAARLLASLDDPFELAEHRVDQHASMGVAIWDSTSSDINELIQKADVALYEAKRQGRRRVTFFTPDLQQEAMNRFTMVQELRYALQHDDLTMHYQPIVDLHSLRPVGFEALMRWQHPERGFIAPSVFIPLAESSDLIFELGAMALHDSLAALATWGSGPTKQPPFVAVNFSARQFREPGMVSLIARALEETAVAPDRLMIEITESVTLLDTTETLEVIDELKELGVAIALDDFGTGYSSLSYLSRLNPSIIKIDKSFVEPARDNAHDDALLEIIVALGNKVHMTMLAEGIESGAQLRRVRELGCDLGQGYVFSPAVPAHLVPSLLNADFTHAMVQDPDVATPNGATS
ncbi:MAG TPA: EAL domain-containing protein [Acidimicrobiales bacterium]|nr:EAL domain-containing protein [Acidimicrobiales bacterium]